MEKCRLTHTERMPLRYCSECGCSVDLNIKPMLPCPKIHEKLKNLGHKFCFECGEQLMAIKKEKIAP